MAVATRTLPRAPEVSGIDPTATHTYVRRHTMTCAPNLVGTFLELIDIRTWQNSGGKVALVCPGKVRSVKADDSGSGMFVAACQCMGWGEEWDLMTTVSADGVFQDGAGAGLVAPPGTAARLGVVLTGPQHIRGIKKGEFTWAAMEAMITLKCKPFKTVPPHACGDFPFFSREVLAWAERCAPDPEPEPDPVPEPEPVATPALTVVKPEALVVPCSLVAEKMAVSVSIVTSCNTALIVPFVVHVGAMDSFQTFIDMVVSATAHQTRPWRLAFEPVDWGTCWRSSVPVGPHGARLEVL